MLGTDKRSEPPFGPHGPEEAGSVYAYHIFAIHHTIVPELSPLKKLERLFKDPS